MFTTKFSPDFFYCFDSGHLRTREADRSGYNSPDPVLLGVGSPAVNKRDTREFVKPY